MLRAALIAFSLSASLAAAEPHLQQWSLLPDRPSEVAVFPAQSQLSVNSHQLGVAGSATLHVHPRFGLQLSGFYNWFTEPVIGEFAALRYEATSNTVPLSEWATFIGFEFVPLSGESNAGRLSFVLSGAAGVGSTRHQLKPPNTAGPATFANTGLRPYGAFGGGLRLELTHFLALRLEVHDRFFPARVTTVNGCTASDLRAMDEALRQGAPSGPLALSPGCDASSFGMAAGSPFSDPRRNDVPLANNLVKPPVRNELVHNPTVLLGVSLQF